MIFFILAIVIGYIVYVYKYSNSQDKKKEILNSFWQNQKEIDVLIINKEYLKALNIIKELVANETIENYQKNGLFNKMIDCYWGIKDFSQIIVNLNPQNLLPPQSIDFRLAVSYYKIGEFDVAETMFIAGLARKEKLYFDNFSKYFPAGNYFNQIKAVFPEILLELIYKNSKLTDEDGNELFNIDKIDIAFTEEKWSLKEGFNDRYWGLTELNIGNELQMDDLELLKYFQNIKEVNINGQRKIKSINGISFCNKIQSFHAANTSISDFQELSHLPCLKHLNLRNIHYYQLYPRGNGFSKHPKLYYIDLTWFIKCPIEKLDLYRSGIINVDQINDLIYIKELNLLGIYLLNQSDKSIRVKLSLTKLETICLNYEQFDLLDILQKNHMMKKVILSRINKKDINQLSQQFPSISFVSSNEFNLFGEIKPLDPDFITSFSSLY